MDAGAGLSDIARPPLTMVPDPFSVSVCAAPVVGTCAMARLPPFTVVVDSRCTSKTPGDVAPVIGWLCAETRTIISPAGMFPAPMLAATVDPVVPFT